MPHQDSPVQGTPTVDRLRAAGLRITAPRVAVLEWLTDHPHTTADQVATGIRQRLGSVSTQAVYDVLGAYAKASLVRRIEPAGHPARFETRTGDNHHHLVCRGCGRTEDVDCVHGAAPCLEPSSAAGFVVEEAEVVFWGLCPDCTSNNDCAAAGTPAASVHHDQEGPA
ncbi:Fur family transcriptional regulator [Amycolatopsis palatopharyngis]|uniref:Fur family transcriptional regulator n=1 Tax=Amycolatopsis palatopharyngis TaxID=187982 RepID=UPI000E280EC8|nr:Fur family transcriptional regulator [Amycolatopsis palatopharyngis]